MSFYNPPSLSFFAESDPIYNPDYFIGNNEETIQNEIKINTYDFLKTDGSRSMTGSLLTPSLELYNNGTIKFTDDTEQTTAFNDYYINNINNHTNKLTKVSYNNVDEISKIEGSVIINKIIFPDDLNNEQRVAFTEQEQQKIKNLSYDSVQNKTSISNNCHIENLTCSNFNVSHLTGTTTNLQSQISNHTNKLTKISYDNVNEISKIEGNGVIINKIIFPYDFNNEQTVAFSLQEREKLKNIFYNWVSGQTSISDNCYIENLTCSNFSTNHLTGTTSNLQTQINSLQSQINSIILSSNNVKLYQNFTLGANNVLNTTLANFPMNTELIGTRTTSMLDFTFNNSFVASGIIGAYGGLTSGRIIKKGNYMAVVRMNFLNIKRYGHIFGTFNNYISGSYNGSSRTNGHQLDTSTSYEPNHYFDCIHTFSVAENTNYYFTFVLNYWFDTHATINSTMMGELIIIEM